MRKRKEIELDKGVKQDLIIEALLDIRELLTKQRGINKKKGRPKKIK